MRCLSEVLLWACVGAIATSCGGGGQSSSGPLAPRGAQCPVGPPGQCNLDAQRSDEGRFQGLRQLAEKLGESAHPLSNATLSGGKEQEPIADHVRSVGLMLSKWHVEEMNNNGDAPRRRAGGDRHGVAERIRCAADKLIELGPSAQESELVCWCQELWRTAQAYSRMGPK